MRKKLTTALMLTACLLAAAQENYLIKAATGINTANDDIACGMYYDQLLFTTNGKQDLVNDYKWNKRNIFHLEIGTRGNTFSEWTGTDHLFSYTAANDEGPASFDREDSVLYFSSANNYGKAKGHNLKIFRIKMLSSGWTEPEVLSICDQQSDYAHPWYDAAQKLLVFSSNRAGGQGLMDIWFCYKTPEGWTEPTNCGVMVNGVNNEIFPSVYDGDIYYSSNSGGGPGGFDLKKALRSQQWKSSVLLENPINSTADDISIFFLNSEKAILSSNRDGGSGGDDIYMVERHPNDDEKHNYTAQLMCDGKPLPDAQVTVTNSLKEIVIQSKTNADGSIGIEPLRLQQRYRLQLGNVDPSLYTKCVLLIKDANSTVVRELRFNANGTGELELLPLNYADLNLMPLEDESLLTIQLEGQIFEEKPGDLKASEPIMILDDKGDPVAVAYTNETGKFKFTDVKPRLEYTFKLAEESKAQNVMITDKGEKIVLPVLDAEVNYQRMNKGDAICLINEYNELIYVSPKDIFVINRIYYEYNSAQLTDEAMAQLDQLSIIMANNTEVVLELRSHTDARGNDDYNMVLSKKRAQSAVQYMSQKKITAKRFLPIGMGETQLLNECDDGITCSEPEHTLNRRTEIKLSKLNSGVQ